MEVISGGQTLDYYEKTRHLNRPYHLDCNRNDWSNGETNSDDKPS